MRVASNAGTDSAPARGDDVWFAEANRDDKVETVRRQCAQDQIKIAQRVGSSANARPGAAGWIVAGVAGGAVGSGRAGGAGD